MIAGALKRTGTLDRLVMQNNPIGVRGGKAMFKLLRVLKDGAPAIDLRGCNFGSIDRSLKLFQFENPTGAYSLDIHQVSASLVASSPPKPAAAVSR